MHFDEYNITILIAFTSGFITFFASCLIPLVPAYLAYISGITITKDLNKDSNNGFIQRDIFLNGLLFTFGFITVFVLLGALASSIGIKLLMYRTLIQKIGGIFFILMGVFMLELIKPMFFLRERKLTLPQGIRKWRRLNSFLVGMTFGFAWTPCIGPILAVILFWASQTATMLQGISLLVAYGLGLGLPFLLVAMFFETISPKLNKVTRFGYLLQKLAGLMIIVIGLLLIFNKLALFTLLLSKFINFDTLAR